MEIRYEDYVRDIAEDFICSSKAGDAPDAERRDCFRNERGEMKLKMSESYYSKTALKKRGWNEKLIEQFLCEPDDTRVGVLHKSGPTVGRYDVDRVHAAEATSEFQGIQQSRQKRRDAANKGLATKKGQVRQFLDGIEVTVPAMEWDVLTGRAIAQYNDQAFEREAGRPHASTDSDESFLNRIRVNYLRHELTAYEQHLQSLAGKASAADARLEVKTKVLNAIASAYPMLASECNGQAKMAALEWRLPSRWRWRLRRESALRRDRVCDQQSAG